MRRQLAIDLGTHAAQRLVQVALNLLQGRDATGRRAVNALEADAETGVLKLEHIVVEQGILLQSRELVEKSDAADAFAEKPAQHAVLRPDVPVLGGDILNDVVGGRANDVLGGVGLSFGGARGADVFLEEPDAVRHDLHQVREGSARKSDPQTTEQEQQRAGRSQNRVLIGGDELVDCNRGRLRLC